MKHIITTKTDEFCKVDTEFEGSAEEAIEKSKYLIALAKPQTGISSAEFNDILDMYLATGKIDGDPGMFEKMSVEQVAILQAIKRSIKRRA